MSKSTQSLAKLRKAVRRAKKDDAADDAGVTTLMLLAPLQVALGLAFGLGLFEAGLVAVLLSVGMGMASAMAAGLLHGIVGRDLGSTGWAAALAGGGVVWQLLLESWTPALLFVGVAAALFVAFWVRRTRQLAREVTSALPPAVVEALVALPKKQPSAVVEAVDRAIRCHAELATVVRGALARESVVDAEALLADAAGSVGEIARRAELLASLRRADAADEGAEALTQQIVELADGLADALQAAVGYAAVRGSEAQDELAAQAEHLRLTAQGLAEVEQHLDPTA